VKLKKKIRKRLLKPVRKLIKRHGAIVAAELVTGLITAAAARGVAKSKDRGKKERRASAA
jgi:hypothetical protein